jgi:hypothetical protein
MTKETSTVKKLKFNLFQRLYDENGNYVKSVYLGSTSWAKTCKEAVEAYCNFNNVNDADAYYAEKEV